MTAKKRIEATKKGPTVPKLTPGAEIEAASFNHE
jgi:hypothetical protein